MPTEPPSTPWSFPPVDTADEHGIVGVGADLAPGTLLAAYRRGIFPMPLRREALGWWSPEPRGVLPLDGLRMTRSLRRSGRRYEIAVDTAFEDVIDACAELPRQGGWITPEMRDAYVVLHELGWAHSVEAWREGTLVGGLYGVAIGGLFAGESMFHVESDASKVALVALVDILREGDVARLLDVQWTTEHLRSLGAVEVNRTDYVALVERAVELPLPERWR